MKECNLTHDIYYAHLNLIQIVLNSPDRESYPDIDIAQTLNALQNCYKKKLDKTISPLDASNILDSSVLQITLGYFNNNFLIKKFIKYLEKIVISQKHPILRSLAKNLCLLCDTSLILNLVTSTSDFYVFFNFLSDISTLPNLSKTVPIIIENSVLFNSFIYLIFYYYFSPSFIILSQTSMKLCIFLITYLHSMSEI